MQKLITFLFIGFFIVCKAQNPEDIIQSFGSNPGFNAAVNTISVQLPDDKILVAGDFTSYNGSTENKIVQLNSDGTKNMSFVSEEGFNGSVTSMAVQSNGKIIVGGSFTTYNGITENRIVRLNINGTTDSSFNTGLGFNGSVSSIVLQADGKIIVGGAFTSYKGITENRIIRLNSDGSKDTSFNSISGFNNFVASMVVQTDEKIVVGGGFFMYNGGTANSIIRLNSDGSRDSSFSIGTGFNGSVNSILLQPDEKIIVGGNFTSYNGTTENRLTRLNVDGTKDNSFNTNTGFNNGVNSMVIQTNGKIIVGGFFTEYNQTSENNIIRLNSDGTKDSTFITGIGFNGVIRSAVIQNNGKIIVGGGFTFYDGVKENGIIRLNSDGTKDSNFITGMGFDGFISSIVVQNNGKIIVGGGFTSYNGVTRKFINRLNSDGTIDPSFNAGSGFNSGVNSILLQPDEKIIVGGNFTSYNNLTANKIIRLNSDGTIDNSFNTGTGFNNNVQSIAIQTDGKIIIGGFFTGYDGAEANRIIRLNTDGTMDASFNPTMGFNNAVNSISVQTDGKIIVGGFFTGYDGVTENRIVRLNMNGTADSSFDNGSGFNGPVESIELQTDGKIVVGGSFTSYKGLTANRIIRLNPDGSKDTLFNAIIGFNGSVLSIAEQTDEKIVVGGNFTSYNGATANGIVRLNANGTQDNEFDTTIGFDNFVRSIVVQTNGRIIVGGGFSAYINITDSAFLVVLRGDNTLSIENFSETKNIYLWPNPSKDILNIKASDDVSVLSIKLYDTSGKLIKQSVNNPTYLNNLATGLYFVKIKTDSGIITKKFTKI